ncbi:hypothetical protein P8452_51082 [Trifolium repens]|nr:hypothetical protein P8452_51082 [Trifolium repens]
MELEDHTDEVNLQREVLDEMFPFYDSTTGKLNIYQGLDYRMFISAMSFSKSEDCIMTSCLVYVVLGSMTKLVTPLVNYFDQERMPPVSRNIAFWRFLERLNKFKYMEWKAIDPEKLEYIMTPAIVGNPGSHYIMKFNS